jgi:hypothetical protein
MKNYIREFLFNIGMESYDFLKNADLLIERYEPELKEIDENFKRSRKIRDSLELRKSLAEKSGVNIYAVNAIVLIVASYWLKDEFYESGYSDRIFWDTMSDLKCKMYECYAVKGVVGTFVEDWYDGFFKMNIFKLGRLEFEKTTFDEKDSYSLGGFRINPGDKIISVHIPSCGSMPRELRLQSYKAAYEFFGCNKEKPLVLMCDSWLLFTENKNIFPKTMNIVDFLNDFYVFRTATYDEYYDCWRLFGRDYNGDPENLPERTTAQKCMKKYLKSGGKPGTGKGISVFDGKRLITKPC